MIRSYRLIWNMLTLRERQQFAVLIVLTILMAVFETVSVAGILPFLSVLARPELLDHWSLQAFARMLGLTDPEQVKIALGLTVFGLVIVGMFVRAGVTYAQIRFAMARNHSVASRLLQGYLAQSYAWYLSRNSAGLSQSLLSEVDGAVRESILPAVLLISNATILALIGGLLFLAEPMVALSAVSLLSIVYILTYIFLRQPLARIGRQRMRTNRTRFQVVQEITGGLKEIKVMGLERVSLDRFRTPARALARHQTAALLMARLPRYVLETVVYGGFITMVLVMIVMRGDDIADLLPLLGLLGMAATKMFPALQQFYQQISSIRFSAATLERLHDDLREAAALPAPPETAATPLHLTREIQFEDVHFRYPKAEHETLVGLNLSIPAHSRIGVVGGTGAGKTTVIDLLLGLLVPDTGVIRVDGVVIDDTNRRAWQQNIGYVPQSIFLTDDTVAANIGFGLSADHIDPAKVEHAARIANLHDFIVSELPEGYATMVGERGVRLSGGQRQRIGIARALYHNPQVLILDEATSALDNITERAVIEAVRNLSQDKTVIMIAHRLTTIEDCNTILMLERGRLVVSGTYAELMTDNDMFRRMADG